ncbi:MAG TPA: hypothetical protein VOA64_06135 [Candidatus Dormibacteraeota bacterium]|nr:hypothetical protein [Candidatus Dormibacteraeota bacterium]
MSTEFHHTGERAGQPPRHADVAYEPRDVSVRTIYWYLFALAVSVLASFIISIYVLRFTTHLVAQWDTPGPPSRQALGSSFNTTLPEPRLQGVPGHEADPQTDLRNKIREDSEANERFGWVDQSAGIAQIPVKEAMKIIAEKGMPAVSAPPAAKKK